MIQQTNKQLLLWFNDLARYDVIEYLSPLIADLPIFFLPLFLFSMWLYYSWFCTKNEHKNKNNLLMIFYGCVIALIINLIIQQFIHFDRPEDAVKAAGKVLLQKLPSASFPSDHAAVSIAFATALFFSHYRKVFYSTIVFFLIMNISRIIVGVHWPFDILAWTLVWIFSGYASIVLLQKNKLVKSLNSFIIQLLSYFKL